MDNKEKLIIVRYEGIAGMIQEEKYLGRLAQNEHFHIIIDRHGNKVASFPAETHSIYYDEIRQD